MAEIIEIPEVHHILHNGGGWTCPVARETADGVAVDISGQLWRLRTQSGLDVLLVADPLNPMGLLIKLTEVEVAGIGADNETEYVLINATATPDEVLAYGRLSVKGW